MSEPDRVSQHAPVMVAEVVDLVRPVPPGTVVDATLGNGGHSRAVLESVPQVNVFGIDKDPDAIERAASALAPFGKRVTLQRASFEEMAPVLRSMGTQEVSGVLFDLGVSSPQLDQPTRGFSYSHDGPLDMRMDPEAATSAADVVNDYSEDDLARVLADYGDERFARRIARAIVAARPLNGTRELADIVRSAIPAAVRRHGRHPARRSFQAIRIEVNRELDVLAGALDDAVDLLTPGGRCVVLTYHSGEDRIVKDRFRYAATGGCTCPPQLPCQCGATAKVRLLKRGRRPAAHEVAANRRAESARLRAVERLHPNPEAAA
ncbi:MAG TPA: 16S rRNA (cytosine(1402)-N(4))-methyltransferase RsmH [Acidimicrobiales bacterium]|nr:16S rRNA (cytosine(1402)-N(4))-methyltransferase RsmH [Acidimicrobiales bacterium]